MPSNSPAQIRDRVSPFFEVFTSFAAAVNLTTRVPVAAATGAAQVAPYQNACSGLVVNVTTAGDLVLKDCTGLARTMPLPVGVFYLPIAATSLEVSTIVGAVLVHWHGNSGVGR